MKFAFSVSCMLTKWQNTLTGQLHTCIIILVFSFQLDHVCVFFLCLSTDTHLCHVVGRKLGKC